MLIISIVTSAILYQSCAAFSLFGFIQRNQCVGAVGQLMCNGRPSPNVTVILYDEDYLSNNDLMQLGLSNGTGHFAIYGCALDMPDIVPKIHIYHHCNVQDQKSPLYLEMFIPYRYIAIIPIPPTTDIREIIKTSTYDFDIIDTTYRSGMEHSVHSPPPGYGNNINPVTT
ncbi:unnamed protein product [Thelazia callipaeda]|uniref:Transthyretin-like family protein n=1 Tax=Thelazia callipaeda TaxID=103827 RepID=A0A0N5CSC9_THECL|nr:unnamed protein product [Thelazia callipaeda]